MPVTHLVDAMESVVVDVGDAGDFAVAVAALLGFAGLAVAMAAVGVGRVG